MRAPRRRAAAARTTRCRGDDRRRIRRFSSVLFETPRSSTPRRRRGPAVTSPPWLTGTSSPRASRSSTSRLDSPPSFIRRLPCGKIKLASSSRAAPRAASAPARGQVYARTALPPMAAAAPDARPAALRTRRSRPVCPRARRPCARRRRQRRKLRRAARRKMRRRAQGDAKRSRPRAEGVQPLTRPYSRRTRTRRRRRPTSAAGSETLGGAESASARASFAHDASAKDVHAAAGGGRAVPARRTRVATRRAPARTHHPRAAARGAGSRRAAGATRARRARAARPRGGPRAPSRASSVERVERVERFLFLFEFVVELVSTRPRERAFSCHTARPRARSVTKRRRRTRRAEWNGRVAYESRRVLRRAHGGRGLVRHRHGRRASSVRPWVKPPPSIRFRFRFRVRVRVRPAWMKRQRARHLQRRRQRARTSRARAAAPRSNAFWLVSVLPRNRESSIFRARRARAPAGADARRAAWAPFELLDLRLRGSARRVLMASSSRAAPWYVGGWNVLSAFCVGPSACAEDEVDPGVDRPADRLALERLAVLQDENPGAPVVGGGRTSPALPVHLARPHSWVSAFTWKSPEVQNSAWAPCPAPSASRREGPGGRTRPVRRRARSANAGGARGRSGAASTARTRGCSACRTGNDSWCVWRIGRCRGSTPVAWPRASAPRCGPRAAGSAPPTARVRARTSSGPASPRCGPQDPGHHRPLRRVAVAPPRRHIQVYEVVERGKVTRAPRVRRGAGARPPGQRRTDAHRAGFSRGSRSAAALAPPRRARRRARLTLRLRAQREPRARGASVSSPGNSPPRRRRKTQPRAAAWRASAWRRRPDAARVAHFQTAFRAFASLTSSAFGFSTGDISTTTNTRVRP